MSALRIWIRAPLLLAGVFFADAMVASDTLAATAQYDLVGVRLTVPPEITVPRGTIAEVETKIEPESVLPSDAVVRDLWGCTSAAARLWGL